MQTVVRVICEGGDVFGRWLLYCTFSLGFFYCLGQYIRGRSQSSKDVG